MPFPARRLFRLLIAVAAACLAAIIPSMAAAASSYAFQNGLAVLEAEGFDASTPRSGREWSAATTPAGAVGTALRATPDAGTGITASIPATSPEVAYRVDFPSAGTYYAWVRGQAPDGAGNSLHLGLDGQVQAASEYLNTSTLGSWHWFRGRIQAPVAQLSVPSAGVHTVHVYMREDGFALDRLLLTASSSYTPSGSGPAASPRVGGEEPPPDTTAPTLTARQPAPGAANVAASANLVATFSEALAPASVGAASVALAPAGGAPVAATIGLSANGTVVTLDPSGPLAEGTSYTATLTTGITDLAGNPLAQPQTWSFTTAAAPPPPPPAASSYAFQNGLAVLEAEGFDASTPRSGREWSAATTPAGAVGTALRATPDAGTGITASIPATSPEVAYRVDFPSAGTYYAWVRGQAPDGAGNSLHLGLDGQVQAASEYLNTSTLGSWHWFRGRIQAPVAQLSVPSAGVHTVHVYMREDGFALDRLLLTASSSYTPSGSGPAASPRVGGEEPPPDTTAPTLTARQPAPGAANVAASANLVATFSEALAPASVGAASVALAPAGGAPVAATIGLSANGTVVTLDPSGPLAEGTSYTATLTTGITDLAGNPLAQPQTWSFTTAAAPPPPPPPAGDWVTTRTRVSTGAMLGQGFNPRWLYVSDAGGPWVPTYADGHPAARGKLMNFRAANAIYDDENLAGYDPDANTNEFIRWIPTYRSLGILGYTVSLQGGKPNYEGNISSAFRPDGSLKPAWLDRAERLIRAADAHGQIIILTYFYKRQENRLEGDAAIRQATLNATDWLIARGLGNVIIEVANEYDTSGYRHSTFTADDGHQGVADLIRLAQGRFAGLGDRLPVGAAHTHVVIPPKIAAVADLTLVHGNPYTPEQDGVEVANLAADPATPGPVVMNEDFNGYDVNAANVEAERRSATSVLQAGGSWGLMWQPYNQKYPFRWAVGSSSDISGGSEANRFRAVLEHVRTLTDPDLTAPSVVDVEPVAGEADVSTSASVTVAFSEALAAATVSGASISLSSGGAPVAVALGASSGGSSYTLTPAQPLQPGTTYTVTVSPSITDAAGNPLTQGRTWSFTTGAAPPPGAGPFLAAAGQVTIEAEGYARRIARSGHDWRTGQSPAGSVGAALLAGPDSGMTIGSNARTTSPELSFDVRFAQPGTYHVWVRGYGPNDSGNSLGIGLDGREPSSAANMSAATTGAWTWFETRTGSPPATITVPTAGQHTLQAYMREDGFHLDRLLLTLDDAVAPTGAGPAASPRA